VSVVIVALSMLTFAHADTKAMFYAAAILFGLGNGTFSPAINAWTVDLGAENQKGRALSTMYIALEIAIGGGAALAGWYFANEVTRMPTIFYTAAGLSVAGLVYLAWYRSVKR
jgi:predicted MFS family arabinose efflux permease